MEERFHRRALREANHPPEVADEVLPSRRPLEEFAQAAHGLLTSDLTDQELKDLADLGIEVHVKPKGEKHRQLSPEELEAALKAIKQLGNK